MMRNKKTIVISVLAVALAAAAVFAMRGENSSEAYANEATGISFKVPSGWNIKETKIPGIDAETTIAANSPDFVFVADDREFPPNGTVQSGYEFNVWVQKPSNVKNFEELQAFYKLGSEGHIVQEEETVTWNGQPALRHKLGDFKSGQLFDLHTVNEGRWITISFSAPADDSEAKALFERILGSVEL
ncbi:MAG TPA: hypothetical protein VEB60_00295 [Candidatus Paceibacterota bacterium]|nr:hypothetical protein [Candidatus Paceibacterota bacterium]